MGPSIAGADLFRMIGSFALVLALMAALLWALRRLQGRMLGQNPGRKLQIIESLSVGPRQRIALIRVGENEVLVGITPTQMTALAQLPSDMGHSTSAAAHATTSDNEDKHVA
jgi:flagellar protein FliO/FliZ